MNDYGYGLWFLVAVNTAVVLLFAVSFFHPSSKRDWRAFGTFSAFVVALFTEMYGVPLTVYLLSSWLGNRFLGLDLTHNGGHLWAELVGWKGDPHLSPFHLASYVGMVAIPASDLVRRSAGREAVIGRDRRRAIRLSRSSWRRHLRERAGRPACGTWRGRNRGVIAA